ncbi:MAG TPA: hypothetical protein VI564_01150 [Candidatus Nanoarchaeia archaeon]|nr:hypothetical protein [Candidatus Nanoarchaeia archaeon]
MESQNNKNLLIISIVAIVAITAIFFGTLLLKNNNKTSMNLPTIDMLNQGDLGKDLAGQAVPYIGPTTFCRLFFAEIIVASRQHYDANQICALTDYFNSAGCSDLIGVNINC